MGLLYERYSEYRSYMHISCRYSNGRHMSQNQVKLTDFIHSTLLSIFSSH